MINKAILMGRLTRDPVIRHTDSGKAVCNFTVAIENGYGEEKSADFVSCVAWNKTAEFVDKYFAKGRMIIVVGRIQTRTWEDRDGKKNYVTEVVASEVAFGETKRNAEGNSAGHTAAGDDFTPIDSDDDLPF